MKRFDRRLSDLEKRTTPDKPTLVWVKWSDTDKPPEGWSDDDPVLVVEWSEPQSEVQHDPTSDH